MKSQDDPVRDIPETEVIPLGNQGKQMPLPIAASVTTAQEPLQQLLNIEQSQCPPRISKEELAFKGRIFDGTYSDVHRAEWREQMVL